LGTDLTATIDPKPAAARWKTLGTDRLLVSVILLVLLLPLAAEAALRLKILTCMLPPF
jgi:hypothetical protein